MAKDKKGFILYADQREQFDQLTDAQAGQLIKHVFSYVNDEGPTMKDALLNMAFTPIKQSLKRDLKHWENVRKKRSDAGKASANKRVTKSTSVESVKQKSTNPTVTVTVNVSVIVKEIKEDRQALFLSWFEYRKELKKPIDNQSTLKALAARFNSEPLNRIEWVVNRSIENKWQGLRWEDYDEGSKKNTLVKNIESQMT